MHPKIRVRSKSSRFLMCSSLFYKHEGNCGVNYSENHDFQDQDVFPQTIIRNTVTLITQVKQ